jgi:serine/threonine protein kinase
LHGNLLARLPDLRFGCPGQAESPSCRFLGYLKRTSEYFPSSRPQLLHRDLASRNVLVDDTMICKVCDFGSARDVAQMRQYESRTQRRLPLRWMAPESLLQCSYSVASDIWSFGILIWEILTLGTFRGNPSFVLHPSVLHPFILHPSFFILMLFILSSFILSSFILSLVPFSSFPWSPFLHPFLFSPFLHPFVLHPFVLSFFNSDLKPLILTISTLTSTLTLSYSTLASSTLTLTQIL